MDYKVGLELKFKKGINVNCWVDGILPAGQMGLKETHLRISLNDFHLDIPARMVGELFEEAVKLEPVIVVPVSEPVITTKTSPFAVIPEKVKKTRKKKDA
jgi:hypothetical protein|tara:strand:+ start:667 stop:966 length:300 start_codon:yes stop_codon:yes gene_type:complete